MGLDNVDVAVSIAAAAVTAVLAVWTAVRTVGRSARLRRDEALWRQALEVRQDRDAEVLQVLHRHTTAQLVAQRLAPPAAPGTRAAMVFGSAAAVLAGYLGALAGAHPGAGDVVEVWTLAFGALIIAWYSFYATLPGLAVEVDARNLLARMMLDDLIRVDTKRGTGEAQRRTNRRLRRFKTGVLTFSVPATVAVLSAAAWAVPQIFFPGSHMYVGVVLVGMVLFILGMALIGWSWRALVEPPPSLHPAFLPPEVLGHHVDGALHDGEDRTRPESPSTGSPLLSWRTWLLATAVLAWRGRGKLERT